MPLVLKDKAVDMPLDQIKTSHARWRQETADKGLEELSDSLKSNGQIHNISLLKNGAKYEVINGHRRYSAAGLGKLPSLRADLYEFEADDGEELDLAIARHLYAANLAEQLLPLEKARMFEEIMRETGFSPEQLAEMFPDETPETLADVLGLLAISEEALEVVEKNPDRFTEAHLRVLADYSGTDRRAWRMKPAEQVRVAREIVEQKDKRAVKDPRKFETRIKSVVNERRRDEQAKKKEETRRQSDPVKNLLKTLEGVDAAVNDLLAIDLAAIKQIDAADKGYALNRTYTTIEQLTGLAEDKLAKLPVRKAAA